MGLNNFSIDINLAQKGILLKKNRREKLKKIMFYIKNLLPGIEKIVLLKKIGIIYIKPEWIMICVGLLKKHNNLSLVTLMDIWGVDYPEKKKRYEINYLLVSLKYNFRIIIRTTLQEHEGIDTISNLFNAAVWLEREIWDMFGVYFYNNKDLRRILTDYGFEGFPLRKDFPLSGFVEVRYDDNEKRVIQEILEIAQEYRVFNFKSPWEKL